ncbi:hypothetical protein [Streptomyces sp. SAI-090]|uniref:hypothetical protein n=1 Tax=Streptomyces sp. SAI-090 TaxID=2940545 RepID=UPI0024734FAD|nr:hypothetical protein [Streptomyces sp. SAI-090]MDH6522204.1 hypothetical protein [Streptomyces sp. SAI-090]
MAAAAVVIAVLLFAAALYDTARLITSHQSRPPPLALLKGRRAALEAEERHCTALLLHGQIDTHSYQVRMSGLAHGRRVVEPRHHR